RAGAPGGIGPFDARLGSHVRRHPAGLRPARRAPLCLLGESTGQPDPCGLLRYPSEVNARTARQRRTGATICPTRIVPMTLLPFGLLAVCLGVALTLQIGSNSVLGRTLGNPSLSAAINMAVGVVASALVVLASRSPLPSLEGMRTAPPW